MKFVKNSWYAAAWAKDVDQDALLYRKIINEPILIRRESNGRAVATSNVCPHRFAPLHLGCKRGDDVQCGYHGLVFNSEGKCVFNPNAPGTIPPAMKLNAYPLVEKHTMLWIWMGDREPLEDQIPDFSILDGKEDGLVRGQEYFVMKCNYELISNNVMDLSHASFLHAGLLATPEHADAEINVVQVERTVTCNRWCRDVPVPQLFDMMFRRDGKNVDFWNFMRWDPPACFLLDVGCHAVGEAPEQGVGIYAMHILTPETESTTHYHVGIARKPASAADEEFQAEIARLRLYAFQNQDAPMMEAMQEMLGVEELLERKPVLFNVDAGPVRMKRVLQELLDAEVATARTG